MVTPHMTITVKWNILWC